jgi:hypothetical protein
VEVHGGIARRNPRTRKRADHLLRYTRDIPIAIVLAKPKDDPTGRPQVLADDPKDKTFAPFGEARFKIESGAITKGREMYFAICQAIARDTARPGLYREFFPAAEKGTGVFSEPGDLAAVTPARARADQDRGERPRWALPVPCQDLARGESVVWRAALKRAPG